MEDDNTTGGARTAVVWQDGPFAMVHMWIVEAGVSAQAIRAYVALAGWYENRTNGEAFPGRRAVADRLRISVDAWDRAIAELKAVGAVSVTAQYRGDGSRSTNLYTLNTRRPHQPGGVAAKMRRGGRTRATAEQESLNQMDQPPSEVGSDIEAVTSPQTLVAYFVDECKRRGTPASRAVIGHAARTIKQLFEDHFDSEQIRRGIDAMLDRGLTRPSLLPEFVMEAKITPKRRGNLNADELYELSQRLKAEGR